MNCDDFLIRMHECIDDRSPFESDLQLQEHAQRCPSCRSQWNAWLQISAVVSSVSGEGQHVDGQTLVQQRRFGKNFFRLGLGLAAAAAIMIVFVARQDDQIDAVREPSLPQASSAIGLASSVADRPVADELDLPRDAAAWWRDVQQRDWLAQTMPTVRRVRDGVAPLGRSILQAVSILTIGGGGGLRDFSC